VRGWVSAPIAESSPQFWGIALCLKEEVSALSTSDSSGSLPLHIGIRDLLLSRELASLSPHPVTRYGSRHFFRFTAPREQASAVPTENPARKGWSA